MPQLPFPTRNLVLESPVGPWLILPQRFDWLWRAKDDAPAQVEWVWTPMPEPPWDARFGRIGLRLYEWRYDDLRYLRDETWWADSRGRGIDLSQVLLPVAGNLPERSDNLDIAQRSVRILEQVAMTRERSRGISID